MMRRLADVSDAELDVLRTLWQEGPATVRDVAARLRPRKRRWAYTTVQTLLTRLDAKGYVKADKRELAHVFRASVSRERFLAQRLRVLADEVCEGTASALVMALVRGRRFSAGEIGEFRRLIDELDQKQQ